MEDVRSVTRSIVAGDAEALATLYRARFDRLYASARRMTGLDEATCLDIVQDAMLRIIRGMRPFDDASSLDAWLTRIVRNAALDHLRRERRRRVRELAAAQRRGSTDDDAPGRVEEQERAEWLRAELARLDGAARALVEMRFGSGMTLDRIGRSVGLSAGSVHARIGRTLGAIRARSQETGDE